ncbi:MAG TPA: sulfite exporter TauE/SafE family protein [Actinomycetota bacterium]|nr:sulfite exporter TauE/SafE family protein [Actinomycetota bacterium]
MTGLQAVLGVAVGFASGILSGLFGVGGGIVTTPAVNSLLGGTAIQAVATPLPVIVPSALVGSFTYAKAGAVDFPAARWSAIAGIPAATLGAYLTELVNVHVLLAVTAGLIALSAIRVIVSREPDIVEGPKDAAPWRFGVIGAAAGGLSGLLGIGGGIVMVPAFTAWIGMPVKRALGTSLLVIPALAIPGTIVHGVLGNIDWAIFAVLTLGVVPGARIGARIAVGARERTLRTAVGLFLLAVAIAYGLAEVTALARGGG